MMLVEHDVEFGNMFMPDDGETPPIMVKQAARLECGCEILAGHKMTPDVLLRAAALSRDNASQEEYDELHKEAMSIAFCSCADADHDRVMNETAAAFWDSLQDPQDRDVIDVAVECYEKAAA